MAFDKQVSWIKENKIKAFLIAVVGLVAFGLINLEILHFSSSPPFCKGLCHTMTAEVEDWEASSHAKHNVDCVGCHYREGAGWYMLHKMLAMNDVKSTYITGYMGRAMSDHEHYGAEKHLEFITEEQAEEEKLMDDIIFPQYIHNVGKDRGAGPSKHVDEDGNWKIQVHRYGFLWRVINENCVNCHSSRGSRGHVSNINVTDFIVKNALFDYGNLLKAGEKPEIGKRRPLGGMKAPHAFHQDRGIACVDCHQEVVHGHQEFKDDHYERSGRRGPEGVVWPRMQVCFKCHNDKRAPADCLFCHEFQKNMNEGIHGRGVDDTAGYMYPDSTTCVDCHLEENNYKMKPQVCIDYHDDESYGADMINEWQSATREALLEVENKLKEVDDLLTAARNQGRDVTSANELFKEAYFNYRMVWYDGSMGVHNIDYAGSLLSVSKEKLDLALNMLMS